MKRKHQLVGRGRTFTIPVDQRERDERGPGTRARPEVVCADVTAIADRVMDRLMSKGLLDDEPCRCHERAEPDHDD